MVSSGFQIIYLKGSNSIWPLEQIPFEYQDKTCFNAKKQESTTYFFGIQ